MKFGNVNPIGELEYDCWEKIYETEVDGSYSSSNLLDTFCGKDEEVSHDADTGQTATFVGNAQLDTGNILKNGDIEDFGATSYTGTGSTTFLTDWYVACSSGSAWERESTIVRPGSTYSVKQTAGNNFTTISQELYQGTWMRGKQITLGAWCYCTASASPMPRINFLDDDIGWGSWDTVHTGSGWEYMEKTVTVGSNTTSIKCFLDGGATGVVTYWDLATVTVEGLSPKIGNACLKLDGSGDYITYPDSADWSFGTGDFTIDLWMKPYDFSSNFKLICQGDTGGLTTNVFNIAYDTTDGILFNVYDGNWNNLMYLSQGDTTGWEVDTWYHIAVVRNGNIFTLYRNGITLNSTTYSGSIPDYSTPLALGRNIYNGGASGTDYFSGYMDAVRITKGEALWTSNFTPPTTIDDYVNVKSINIFSLEGNTDEEYMLDLNIVGDGSAGNIALRFNGDSDTGNYGYQYLSANNTTLNAVRLVNSNWIHIANASSDGDISSSYVFIHTKPEHSRISLCDMGRDISGTTITALQFRGACWNNVIDELSSMIISTMGTGTFKIGSTISLYRRKVV